jgi:6-phosphogluconolactonase/glucosamine-6-phosphate isomerase/deaminase
VADFADPQVIKPVELDDACRQQQVNDGCFPSFAAVPTHALTLTIPTLMCGAHLFCAVPGPDQAGGRRADAERADLDRVPEHRAPAARGLHAVRGPGLVRGA